MRRKQIPLFFISLLLFQSVLAQEKLSLDIESAKEYALEFNKTIKNSELSVLQSQESIKEAISAGLPQINADVDYSKQMGDDISVTFGSYEMVIPLKPSSNFKVQVGQLIFSGSYLVGVQSAKLYEKLTETNKAKTESDVVNQVAESYYLALLSKESLAILESNLENLETVYKKTEPMVTFGMMEQVDLDQLLVQVNAVKNSLKSAKRQYELTKNMLRLQLGVSADTELEFTEKLADLIDEKEIQSTSAGNFDLNRNIDYQLSNIQSEVTDKQLKLQKAAYLPTISSYYSYTYKILSSSFDITPPHVVGLQMNIPVFAGGERRSKVRQAEIDMEITRNNQSLLEDQLKVQYNQLRFNLLNAFESYQNQKENVQVSREVYKSLKKKYDHGVISSLDLITSDNNYLTAESNYLLSMLEVLKAQNNLNTLKGEINK